MYVPFLFTHIYNDFMAYIMKSTNKWTTKWWTKQNQLSQWTRNKLRNTYRYIGWRQIEKICKSMERSVRTWEKDNDLDTLNSWTNWSYLYVNKTVIFRTLTLILIFLLKWWENGRVTNVDQQWLYVLSSGKWMNGRRRSKNNFDRSTHSILGMDIHKHIIKQYTELKHREREKTGSHNW